MKAFGLMAIAACLPICALAQGVTIAGGGGGSRTSGNGISEIHGNGTIAGAGRASASRPTSLGSLQTSFRLDPLTGMPPARVTFDYHGRSIAGKTYFTRTLMDSVHHEYFGYEVLLEQQQAGSWLATFGNIAVSPLEAAATDGASLSQWSLRALGLPAPKVVRDGDTISIELFTDAATGDKLIDDITIQPFSQRPTLPNMPTPGPNMPPSGFAGGLLGGPLNRAVPTVEGTARDFSAADAEMRLLQPRATVNGTPQSEAGRVSGITGSLIWFYLPGRGRYILSLAPRPELDFQRAGEVRGGSITLTLGGDAIKLECPTDVVNRNAPYNLYVLRDPEWEPATQAQKEQLAFGSVAPEELAILKRR